MVLSLPKQNTVALAKIVGTFKASSTSNVCTKEGSSETMMMKNSKEKKIIEFVMSVNSDRIHAEQVSISSDILSVGQPVSWRVYVNKIATKFNLRVLNF